MSKKASVTKNKYYSNKIHTNRVSSLGNPRKRPKKKLFLKKSMVIHFINWISSTYGIHSSISELFYPFIDYLINLETNKGPKYTIHTIKEIRVVLENYFLGARVNPSDFKMIRLRFCGIPALFGKAIHYMKREDPNLRIMVLSILTLGRSMIFEKDPDYSTITSMQSRKFEIPQWVYKSFISRIKDISGHNLTKIPLFEGYHYSVRSSPLGENSMESSMVELSALFHQKGILDVIFRVGGPTLKFQLEFLISNYRYITQYLPGYTKCIDKLIKKFKSFNNFVHPIDIHDIKDPFFGFLSHYVRKLVSFAEYEGKTRIIGLVEYWSQCALQPLASLFFKLLSSLPQDQTFDQAKGCKELSFNNHTIYYSYDLSAFTDRFPLSIIHQLLSSIYDENYANDICYLLSGIPFWSQDHNDFIRYEVGNPMGTKASWALTTLCHHFIIYWCCLELDINFKHASYKMLGDDIIIWDCRLAELYLKKIKSIGVECSSKKSIISSRGFTFAKRLFTPYGEISPVSYRLWTRSLGNLSMVSELTKLCLDRSSSLLKSHEDIIKDTVDMIKDVHPIGWKRLKSRDLPFLLDQTIKERSLFSNVQHNVVTYVLHMNKDFLPWPIEYQWRLTLQKIMLAKIKNDILNFSGAIQVQEQVFVPESELDQFQRERALAFHNDNVDELNDLLNICVPHLFINENLINRKLYDMMLKISSNKGIDDELLSHYCGFKILNHNRIVREESNLNELSPSSLLRIEISKLMISTKNLLYKELGIYPKDYWKNSVPLMCIPNSEVPEDSL